MRSFSDDVPSSDAALVCSRDHLIAAFSQLLLVCCVSLRQRLVYEVSLQRMEENVFLAQNHAFTELGKFEDATRVR